MQLQDLQNVERRVKSYWFSDGWAEMAGGGVLVLLGLFFAGQEWLPKGSPAGALFGPGLLLLFVVCSIITRRLVNAMKTRYTYPHTGYVSYRVDQQHTRRRQLAAGAFAAVFAAALVFLGARLGTTNWVPGVSGMVVGGILLYMGAKVGGLRRFYWLAAFSGLLGIALSFGPIALGYRLALFYGLVGLSFMGSGAWRLHRYLAGNPLTSEAPRGQ